MNDKTYFKVVVSLNNYYSWETFLKHAISIKSNKELNHECEVEDSSRNIETNLINEWFKT